HAIGSCQGAWRSRRPICRLHRVKPVFPCVRLATSTRDANSPIMTAGALVLAEGIVGMTEASATRRASTPRTRSSASTTASRPEHRQDRTELLLANEPGAVGDVADDRRPDEQGLPREQAAGDDRPVPPGVLEEPLVGRRRPAAIVRGPQ